MDFTRVNRRLHSFIKLNLVVLLRFQGVFLASLSVSLSFTLTFRRYCVLPRFLLVFYLGSALIYLVLPSFTQFCPNMTLTWSNLAYYWGCPVFRLIERPFDQVMIGTLIQPIKKKKRKILIGSLIRPIRVDDSNHSTNAIRSRNADPPQTKNPKKK